MGNKLREKSEIRANLDRPFFDYFAFSRWSDFLRPGADSLPLSSPDNKAGRLRDLSGIKVELIVAWD